MGVQPPSVLIVVGSPRAQGRSAQLANQLAAELRQRGAQVCLCPLSRYPVAACNGCGSCSATGACVIVNDGFGVLSRHIDSCDVAFIVAPVYFSGPSGWLKAALDRCQVYWARRYVLGQPLPARRPAHLLVVGEGGDPFGYGPLVTCCTSALNSTGLRVEGNVHDFVGDNYSLARLPLLAEQALAAIEASEGGGS